MSQPRWIGVVLEIEMKETRGSPPMNGVDGRKEEKKKRKKRERRRRERQRGRVPGTTGR